MLTYVGLNEDGEKQYIGTDKDWRDFEREEEEDEPTLPEDPDTNDNDERN